MEELIMQLVCDILVLLITLATGYAVVYLRKRLGTEGMKQIEIELALKQELATLAVRFVEQVWKDLHGQAKYEQAAIWLSERAKELGLAISDQEIKGLIEAALRSFKDEFGEEWVKTK